jgi:hypothetical protein
VAAGETTESKKNQVIYILVICVTALANTTGTEMSNLDRFNEAFDLYSAPFAVGFLVGFSVCIFRFVW